MRFLRTLIFLILIIGLGSVLVNHGQEVALNFDPFNLGLFTGSVANAPLWIVMLGCVFLGMILGWLWELIRGRKARGERNSLRREVKQLRKQTEALKKDDLPEALDNFLGKAKTS